jgi:hypothetical protein
MRQLLADTTLRFKELPLSSCRICVITSSFELGLLTALGSIDKELLASRIIVTGSPGLRCMSFIHLLGNDSTYVDLPVNCILRTSLLSVTTSFDILKVNVIPNLKDLSFISPDMTLLLAILEC